MNFRRFDPRLSIFVYFQFFIGIDVILRLHHGYRSDYRVINVWRTRYPDICHDIAFHVPINRSKPVSDYSPTENVRLTSRPLSVALPLLCTSMWKLNFMFFIFYIIFVPVSFESVKNYYEKLKRRVNVVSRYFNVYGKTIGEKIYVGNRKIK